LRDALDFVRDEAAKHFERLGGQLFIDPWSARNASIELILDSNRSREEFLSRHARKELTRDEEYRALVLLELQRNALLMYTSCVWFFSDLSGIETIQVMKYAARVIELMHELGLPSVRQEFLDLMEKAKSNIRDMGTGANIYLRYAEPSYLAAEVDIAVPTLS
jgi:alpha-amylase/alpha-mannosidase (GH57 family)